MSAINKVNETVEKLYGHLDGSPDNIEAAILCLDEIKLQLLKVQIESETYHIGYELGQTRALLAMSQ